MHVGTCVRISFLFGGWITFTFCLSILLLMGTRLASTFRLLWLMLLWAWVYKYLFETLFSVLWDMYPEMEFLDPMAILCLIFWGTILFSIAAALLYISSNSAHQGTLAIVIFKAGWSQRISEVIVDSAGPGDLGVYGLFPKVRPVLALLSPLRSDSPAWRGWRWSLLTQVLLLL